MANASHILRLLQRLQAKPQMTNPDALQVLLDMIEAIEACPKSELTENLIIEATVPYLAPTIAAPVPISIELPVSSGTVTPPGQAQPEVSGAALTIILTIIRRLSNSSPTHIVFIPDNVTKTLASCWPLTSSALLLYARAIVATDDDNPRLARQVGSPGHAFITIVSLLQTYAHAESLRTLVQNTPTALYLVASIWKFEVNGQTEAHEFYLQLKELFPHGNPPSAATLLPLYLFTLPSPKLDAFLAIVDYSSGESAAAAMGHFNKSLKALHLDASDSAVIGTFQANLDNLIAFHSTSLQQSLLKKRSPILVVESLVWLTSKPFNSTTAGLVGTAIEHICVFLNNYLFSNGIWGLVLALEQGLGIGLFRACAWIDSLSPASPALEEYRRLAYTLPGPTTTTILA
ncbi:FAD/NAD(P)-binding domain-containing protein [Mycena indigotica]|uniref:FAD/NAD(P)-binding domain-containing protein n=1 Tax=Mycena indigotica TaxID=2126181 RepID=A0A8H6T849_9AGAR|nr:FAD/NAD(P)-binding domain-containing protein [Mycena indigotica]KAF7312675.1 FAD/NAD(P)-binding domain-containing protein [Mycena indigotica]